MFPITDTFQTRADVSELVNTQRRVSRFDPNHLVFVLFRIFCIFVYQA